MNVAEALKTASLPPLEIEVLLSTILGKNRAWILSHPEYELSMTSQQFFSQSLRRREAGEPLAYITGEKEFYGRSFIVNHSVLIPRPSTEGLIDLTLEFLRSHEERVREVDTGIVCFSKYLNKCLNIESAINTIVDIGTGSGCIAITLALELPNFKFIATDVSNDALEVARANAQKHDVLNRIEFRSGKNLDPINDLDVPFLLVSNLPYIPEGEAVSPDVHFEPKSALFAGKEGLDVITPLVNAAQNHSACNGLVLECRKEQASSLLALQ
ncbi:MAG: peptide chain release factor N(5)-glutamine methyltransferase [Patescibacteria group bacterium]